MFQFPFGAVSLVKGRGVAVVDGASLGGLGHADERRWRLTCTIGLVDHRLHDSPPGVYEPAGEKRHHVSVSTSTTTTIKNNINKHNITPQ